ncbi:MAG: RES family NAD+ phosphorylase [Flavobacteriales bacterium]
MTVFRLARAKHESSLLSGIGGEYASGRWHKKGERIIYTSEHRSLCLLEKLVHVQDTFLLPDDLKLYELELPKNAKVLEADSKFTPKSWEKLPYSPKTQELFHDLRVVKDKLLIRVPSAVIPQEFNVIINPYHSDISKVKIKGAHSFKLDSRL